MPPSRYPKTADSMKLNGALRQLGASGKGRMSRYSDDGTGEHTAVSAQFFNSNSNITALPPAVQQPTDRVQPAVVTTDSIEEYLLPAIGLFLLFSLAFWLFAYPAL